MTNVLIMAAGAETRWTRKEYPKQLAPIGMEPLLLHTLHQLGVRIKRPTVVSSSNTFESYARGLGAHHFKPTMHRWLTETLLYCRHLWLPGAVILLGDVCYSNAVLDEILKNRRPVRFYGNTRDIFALTFHKSKAKQIEELLNRIQQLAEWGQLPQPGCGMLWHLYRLYCGFPVDQKRLEDKNLRVVSDFTADFDTVEDYEAWLKEYGTEASGEAARHRD